MTYGSSLQAPQRLGLPEQVGAAGASSKCQIGGLPEATLDRSGRAIEEVVVGVEVVGRKAA